MTRSEKRTVKAKPSKEKLKRIKSPRQLLLIKKLSEIVGKTDKKHKHITLGKLMREVGYSVEYSKSPEKVTKSKGWLQLLEEYFPDKLISERMMTQLNAQAIEHYVFSSKTPDEEIRETIEGQFGFKVMKISNGDTWKRAYFSVPDHNSRDKVIEKLLKLKNKYPAEKHEHMVAVVKVVKYE